MVFAYFFLFTQLQLSLPKKRLTGTSLQGENIPSVLEVRSDMMVFKRLKNARLNTSTFAKIWIPQSTLQQDSHSSSQIVLNQAKSS